jgi:putative SOS response-associated peptidase YedK
MCNHYRQAILKGENIPGWSIDQFSDIKVPLRFHNMLADVYPDREGLVIHLENGEPIVDAMRWGFPRRPTPAAIT